ncbi:MAG TPA: HEAT repeat domain-containing protein [Candidatus Ozemobacteraceae bacterium]|nr:HEAT repeat domain-containing protein [Candidatus Ozemobacteraceae bacterium]
MPAKTTTPRKPFPDLNHKEWEKRFVCAKRLSTPAGQGEFRKLAAASRREVTKRLVDLLNDDDSRVRMQTAAALGNLGCRDAAEALITALADPNEWVRVQVVEALGRIGTEDLASILAHHLEGESEAHVRATLIKVLGMIGSDKLVPVLALYLEDRDARVRANCVEAMLRLNSSKDAMRRQLLKLTSDVNNRVLANTALGLVSLGERRGRAILVRMLESADEYMRASATYALGEIRDRHDLSTLVRLLGDNSWMVRQNAVRALVKFGRTILEVMRESLRSTNPAVRLGALDVCGHLGGATLRQSVIELLEDDSGEVRSKAEEVLDRLAGH